MLCRASLPSVNMGVALLRWCRHYEFFTKDVHLELTVEAATARLEIHERVDLKEQREFCLVSIFRSIHGYLCWLIDSRIALTRVAFPFLPPRHANCYQWMFRGPVSFGEPLASLSFDVPYLSLPVRRDDRDLRQMLQRPLHLIVLQYRRDRLTSHQIRKILRTGNLGSWSAEALAAELNLSTRSLYRHLEEEGSSLQDLKDTVRREMAIEQLTRTSKALKQVAVAVGFRNETSFSRAFRQWTGQTPGEYRQSVASG